MSVGGLVRWSLGAGLLGTAIYSSTVIVDGGHRAVVFDRFSGISPNTRKEGINFIVPFIQWPFIYEIRTRPAEYATETGSKDLQTVGITLRLLFRPEADKLPQIHQKLGPEYDNVFNSIANEVLKSVVAQYDAQELITQREAVSAKVREELTARASKFNLILDDVSLKHVSFGSEFTHAIERKQVSQQEAERSKFLVTKAEQEKLAKVTLAEGEAEAAKLIIDSLQNGPGFIELRKIEAMREIADTLARSRNISWVPNGMNMLLTGPQAGGGPGNQPQNANFEAPKPNVPQFQYQMPPDQQIRQPQQGQQQVQQRR